MQISKGYNYSYWEIKSYFKKFDLIVVGSGIVGLSTAISFSEKNKKASILILERGIMPDGASTKNAGFVCFGSAGELLDDLKYDSEENVLSILKMRFEGLQMLRKRLGDKNINLQYHGGYELFDNKSEYEFCLENLPRLNKIIKEQLGLRDCFRETKKYRNDFGNLHGIIFNPYEGQLDTAMMMKNLALMAHKKNIVQLHNITVKKIKDTGNTVELISNAGVFKAAKVVVATNGFASQLLKLRSVKPARAQVLITKPIPHLKIKGTFHLDKGYYYFRNIDERILFGGGRNLDFESETTFEPGITKKIQYDLEKKLREIILPSTKFEIEQRWSGIMGVGNEKTPIIKNVSPNVLVAVRMGGMGIAIGSRVGNNAADQVMK